MKKLFLGLALMLTMVLTAQVEELREYTAIYTTKKGEEPVFKLKNTTTYLYYENRNIVKTKEEGGKFSYFDLADEMKHSYDDAGNGYTMGMYNFIDYNTLVGIQIYDDTKKGIRFIFPITGTIIQYY